MSNTVFARLEAESAIRRVVSAYCDAVCRRDPDGAGLLFAPDVRVTIAGGPEIVGRAAMIAGMRQTFSSFSLLYQNCDAGLIDVEDDRAWSRMSVIEASRKPDDENLSMIFGTYEDEYARLQEGWRFHRRRYSLGTRVLLPVMKGQHLPIPELARIFAA